MRQHSLKPQERHLRHPSCRSTWLPQSGQAPRAIS
ncbi:MAG: hypothetical protein H6Q79_2880, partial [Deltaproteobacteria bacterium]|nr:hypothetical protein [Deltaproteobacteria bacterium]